MKHHRNAKPRPHLFPWEVWDHVMSAIEDGARKYAPDDWKKNTATLHADKAMRHLIAWYTGEIESADNHVRHLAAVAVNALFALWLEEHAP